MSLLRAVCLHRTIIGTINVSLDSTIDFYRKATLCLSPGTIHPQRLSQERQRFDFAERRFEARVTTPRALGMYGCVYNPELVLSFVEDRELLSAWRCRIVEKSIQKFLCQIPRRSTWKVSEEKISFMYYCSVVVVIVRKMTKECSSFHYDASSYVDKENLLP